MPVILSKCGCQIMEFWGESARKITASPIESELYFLTGTFLNNYDVINRKLQPFLIHSTVENEQKERQIL